MIRVERFINQLMASNCFIVSDEVSKRCICIDPASEKSEREIEYIEKNGFTLDYIFLTHEHTDHTWGVNALLAKYPLAKVICSLSCRDALTKEAKVYFQLYYDDPNYSYNVARVDCTTENLGWQMEWSGHNIVFIPSPGHSPGSICVEIEDKLFSGDTIMQYKPFIKKRNGGSIEQYKQSVGKIIKMFPEKTMVYPGHGERISLLDWKTYYYMLISHK